MTDTKKLQLRTTGAFNECLSMTEEKAASSISHLSPVAALESPEGWAALGQQLFGERLRTYLPHEKPEGESTSIRHARADVDLEDLYADPARIVDVCRAAMARAFAALADAGVPRGRLCSRVVTSNALSSSPLSFTKGWVILVKNDEGVVRPNPSGPDPRLDPVAATYFGMDALHAAKRTLPASDETVEGLHKVLVSYDAAACADLPIQEFTAYVAGLFAGAVEQHPWVCNPAMGAFAEPFTRVPSRPDQPVRCGWAIATAGPAKKEN